jgi:AraC family transcriptional regulator of adaptative response/methylated-DNA-[protein]-cysteine methyltransferase
MDNQTSLFGYQDLFDSDRSLSDTGFVIIEKMSVEDFVNSQLRIQYSFEFTRFGETIIASTDKGICFLAFVDDRGIALQYLKAYYPNALIECAISSLHETALQIINGEPITKTIVLHINGTDFQFLIWQKLLEIPSGKLISYSHLARSINKPKAARAVGTAIGSNPIAYLIPCHRVIQSNGSLGGYMWGLSRKSNIISWESNKF